MKLPKIDEETKVYILMAVVIFLFIMLLPQISSLVRSIKDWF